MRLIIAAVKADGDAALARYGVALDGAVGLRPDALKASAAEFDAAFATLDPDLTETIRWSIANIRAFHEEQLPDPMFLKEIRPGAFAGDRFTPLRSAALYVPRGKGSFPSVTMMTSVPAKLAGVETVYKVGGAQAVAAAA